MIYLSNDCRCSDLNVTPQNWKTNQVAIKKDWFITYRFYDPSQIKRYPKGKLVMVKGMNTFKSITERRSATKAIIENELKMLKDENYNPITNIFTQFKNDFIISPNLPCLDALKLAKERLSKEKRTIEAIDCALNGFCQTATILSLNTIPICDFRRRHIIQILDYRILNNNMSADRRNKYVAYLSMIFNELKRIETIEENPTNGIEKEKTITRIRTILNETERKKIDKFLRKEHYMFWRFMQIFFHSGARETELMLLKKENVNIRQQFFIVLIKKGQQYVEVKKPIKNIILPLWNEIVEEASNNQYLFSKNLKPGTVSISPRQITRRWNTHIKQRLGINADFYSLKHLNLDEISATLSIQDAARLANHTSIKTTLSHYAVNEKERQLERIRSIKNSFA